MTSDNPLLVDALVACLLREGVDADRIYAAVSRVKDLDLIGKSIDDGDHLVRAFAQEQARRLRET